LLFCQMVKGGPMLSVLVILPLHSLAQHIKTILLRYPERFRIVGTADNSVLGMSMIESSRPDVVIMPVYMNFWNAEDLINYLLPRGAAPAFVLLEEEAEAFPPGTAAAQVAAVLPTHVPTERQLLKALDKVDALQERRKASLAQAPPHNQTIQHSLEVMELLMGLTPLHTGAAQMEFGRLRVGKRRCWLLLCAPRPMEHTGFSFFSQLDDLGAILEGLHTFLEPLGCSEVCVYRESNLCILLASGQAKEPDWDKLCPSLNAFLHSMGIPELLFEISDTPLPLERWHEQCQELLRLRENRFFYSPPYLQPKLLSAYHISATQSHIHGKLSAVSQAFQSRIRDGLIDALQELELMVSHSLSGELYSFVSTQLMVLHSRLRYSYDLQNAEEGLSSLQFTSVSDAFSAFQALFLNLFSQMGDLHGGTNQIVAGACSYINQNLSEPLNLESVARRVHVSPTYLSRLFKQETGSLFNTYVNQRRVLRAAQLLETHYKITDIAGMVGFGNAKYFSQVFRRYTGKTPWQYRQELREEGTS
jgi:AraC-like DNA-binding protein/DNA-binding NarL/FixJ family response regulator